MQDILDVLNKESKDIHADAKVENGMLFVVLKGIIDTYNSNMCMKALDALAERKLASVMIIDMTAISYVSSTGIGQFLAVQKTCAKNGENLYFLHAQDKVRDVFRLLGFEQFLNFIQNASEIEVFPQAAFPVTFQCPHCNTKLKAPKPGKFKCSNCKETISVSATGSVN
jgi:anti-sigma B factor antagonist